MSNTIETKLAVMGYKISAMSDNGVRVFDRSTDDSLIATYGNSAIDIKTELKMARITSYSVKYCMEFGYTQIIVCEGNNRHSIIILKDGTAIKNCYLYIERNGIRILFGEEYIMYYNGQTSYKYKHDFGYGNYELDRILRGKSILGLWLIGDGRIFIGNLYVDFGNNKQKVISDKYDYVHVGSKYLTYGYAYGVNSYEYLLYDRSNLVSDIGEIAEEQLTEYNIEYICTKLSSCKVTEVVF